MKATAPPIYSYLRIFESTSSLSEVVFGVECPERILETAQTHPAGPTALGKQL